MKKKKKKQAKCPSCNTERHKTEMKEAIFLAENLSRTVYNNYKGLGIDTYQNFIDCDFNWACDHCLQTKKAIAANPVSQNYCWSPNYAYFDSEYKCRTCGNDFIFSKLEKKYWYETLHFWIDSEPVNCVNCRKEVRKYKSESKIISEILRKDESEILIEELEKIIEIYTAWGKEQKAKYYLSLKSKKNKRSEHE